LILDDEEAPGGRGGIHCRVTMNTIASSEAIAVKLQKICMSIPIPAGFARSSGWLPAVMRPRRFCTRPALVHGAEMAESRGRTSC